MSNVEETFYQTVYTYPNKDHSLVFDSVTKQVYFRKVLHVYSPAVFEYLYSHHNAHISSIHAFYEEGNTLIVIEDKISGITLTEYLEQPHTLQEKKEIYLQILDGVYFLYQAKPSIIHRDLKADNIMIDDTGTVKIIDYDAAKQFDSQKDRDTVLIGTEGSAASEQYGFAQSDARTDIYALGILLKEMFPSDRRMLKIAEKACHMDPKDRYEDVQELKSAVTSGRADVEFTPVVYSGNIRKNILFFLIYLFLFLVSINVQVTPTDGGTVTVFELWLYRVVMVIITFLIFDLYSNWFGIFHGFMVQFSDKPIQKVVAYTSITFLIPFLCFIVVAIVLNL